jgi:cell division septal protein FtsQ
MRFHPRLILLLSVLLTGALAYLLGFSNVFVVKEIKVDIEDKSIATQVRDRLAQRPAVVELGDQIARVDRREIATRLREFAWVENVELERNLINGELLIKVISRTPIARLTSTTSPQSTSIGFMGEDLDYFYLPRQAIDQAIASGDKSWQQIPELTLPAGPTDQASKQLKAEARELIELYSQELAGRGFELTRVSARDSASFNTSAKYLGRSIEISWGSISDLGLKVEVMERLLAEKENKKIRRINLIDPLKPTVR